MKSRPLRKMTKTESITAAKKNSNAIQGYESDHKIIARAARRAAAEGNKHDFARLEKQKHEHIFGCALAMRVLQSDLYHQLDDTERAECDELITRWHEHLKQEAQR